MPSESQGIRPSEAPASPRLRPARFDDYAQIERLESAHDLVTLSPEAWRHLWLDNHLVGRLGEAWPIGWVLEDASGRIVGSLANIPTSYSFRGRELTAATAHAWVAEPKYRAVALRLIDEYFQQTGVDLFINNTVSAMSIETFSAFGSARVPLGDWESAAYCITGYRGFAAAALRIKGIKSPTLLAPPAAAVLKLRDRFRAKSRPAKAASVSISDEAGFDCRFDAFWKELVSLNPDRLLCTRDCRTLAWHFATPLAAGQAWIVTATRNFLLRAYAIFKRQDHEPSGLRRMRLVDYQTLTSEIDLLPSLLDHALRRCAREGIHTLEHVGCDLPKMRSFDAMAPYRRPLHSWPFYYTAADPLVEAELRNPNVWDPSTFDADASL